MNKCGPIAFWCALVFPANSAWGAVANGSYIAEGGAGHLTISSVNAKSFEFQIATANGMGNVCEASGKATISGNKGEYKTSETGDKCEIAFAWSDQGVEVQANCDEACGLNASMDGSYRVPGAKCSAPALKARNASFQRLYGQKKYQEAMDALNPSLKDCGFFLLPIERAWVLSNLAVASYHSGDRKKCLENVGSIESLGILDQESPLYAKELEKLRRAVKINKTLCQKAAAGRQS